MMWPAGTYQAMEPHKRMAGERTKEGCLDTEKQSGSDGMGPSATPVVEWAVAAAVTVSEAGHLCVLAVGGHGVTVGTGYGSGKSRL